MEIPAPTLAAQALRRYAHTPASPSFHLPAGLTRQSGYDLEGNTYWTFRPPGYPSWRRIVDYPRSTNLSEVKVPPQWHSWLRYTRPEPPTLEEQKSEAVRQERIKLLAAQADARWEAKERIAGDMPGREEAPSLGPAVPSVEGGNTGTEDISVETGARGEGRTVVEEKKKEKKEDPWAKARGGGEGWQPEAWTPNAKK